MPRSRLRHSDRKSKRYKKKTEMTMGRQGRQGHSKNSGTRAAVVEGGRGRTHFISAPPKARPSRFHPPSTLSSCSLFTADQPSSFTPENHLLMLLCPNQHHHRNLDFSSSPLVEIEEFANILNLAPLAHSTDFRVICEITYGFLGTGREYPVV